METLLIRIVSANQQVVESYLVASRQKKGILEDLPGHVSSYTRKALEGGAFQGFVVTLLPQGS